MSEKKIEKKYSNAEECPITASIGVIGGKWKPIIIWVLMNNRPVRFGELHRMINGITLKMLSRQLKELENDGVIKRKVYAEVPPRVEYSLTDKGKTLLNVMNLLADWSRENIF